MKARIPTAKAEKDAFNEYIKRNFNLYAERNKDGYCSANACIEQIERELRDVA